MLLALYLPRLLIVQQLIGFIYVVQPFDLYLHNRFVQNLVLLFLVFVCSECSYLDFDYIYCNFERR